MPRAGSFPGVDMWQFPLRQLGEPPCINSKAKLGGFGVGSPRLQSKSHVAGGACPGNCNLGINLVYGTVKSPNGSKSMNKANFLLLLFLHHASECSNVKIQPLQSGIRQCPLLPEVCVGLVPS